MILFRFTFLLLLCSQFSLAQNKRPNIIFILSDDHAYQAIGAYGNQLARTPNIDRIAKEGARFNNMFITNSICGPSRACFLTGKYSHVNGYTLNERVFDNNQAVFPTLLQKAGYQTAWIGKMHLGTLPSGFDYLDILPGQGQYYNPDFINTEHKTRRVEGYVTDLITQFSLDWLKQRDTTKPFFLVVGEKATHREWLPALEDLGVYDSVQFPLPANFYDDYQGRNAAAQQDMTIDKTMRLKEDLKVHADYEHTDIYNRFTPEQKSKFYNYYENKVSAEFDRKKLTGKALVEWKYQRYLKDYLATANSLDRNIGRILDWLDRSGLAGNTIVIYASDQGFYLGEHGWFDKRFMYEESLRTAFLMRWPGKIKPGSQINAFALGIDWAPTLLNAAGVKVPAGIQGKSFLSLLNNKNTGSWRKEIYYHYYEFPEPHHVYPHVGIRTQQYKLIKFYGGISDWELFDLEKDPHEMKNIYAQKGNERIIANLKADLEKLMKQYRDTAALRFLK